MWVCRKCKTQVTGASKICRACGGILEEVPDAQLFVGDVQVVEEDDVSASKPPSGSTQAAAKANVLSREERPISEKASAGPDWKCPRCSELVPGNFDVCWKCLCTKTGEQTADAMPVLAELVESDKEDEASVQDAEALKPEVFDEPSNVPSECPSCGSTKIIPGLTVVDQGEGSDGERKAVIFGSPQTLIFKDRLYGEIKADICGKCGHVELRVTNPRELYEHYQKSRGLDRPFDTRQLSPIPCQRCRMLMDKASGICPHCGASQVD